MTLHEAQKLWNDVDSRIALSEEGLNNVIRDSNALDRAVRYRDIGEWAATVVLFATFGGMGILPGTPSAWYFAAAVMALIPGVFLIASRIRGKRDQIREASKNREYIEGAIRKFQRQEHLLGNVVSWYLAPLFVSAMLFIVGTAIHIPGFDDKTRALLVVGQTGFCLILFSVVWWINIRAARTRLRPKREEMENLLSSLSGS